MSQPTTIERLLEAKRLSDAGDYMGKAAVLRPMMYEHPDQWVAESPAKGVVGLRHKPTGFRFHLPPGQVGAYVETDPGFDKAASFPTDAELLAQVEAEPSEAQKASGNYRMAHVRFLGFNITLENPRGSRRSGVSPDGTKWSNILAHHYGYIKGTEGDGRDGDHIDCYIGPDLESEDVWVIDQVHPDTGKFDEVKVCFGFPTEEAAKEGYLACYQKGWKGLGRITKCSKEDLEDWFHEDCLPARFSEFRQSGLQKAAVIKKKNGKYLLYTRDGARVLGTHDTRAEAIAQEYAIQKSRVAREGVDKEASATPASPWDAYPWRQAFVDHLWKQENAASTGRQPDGSWAAYGDPNGKQHVIGAGIKVAPGTRMTQEQLDQATRAAFDEHVARARKWYPDYDSLPPEGQQALLDAAWMGVRAPKMHGAIQRGDYAGAVAENNIGMPGNPLANRNAARVNLLAPWKERLAAAPAKPEVPAAQAAPRPPAAPQKPLVPAPEGYTPTIDNPPASWTMTEPGKPKFLVKGSSVASPAPATGGLALRQALADIDLDAMEAEQRQFLKGKNKAKRERAIKVLGVIQGLKRNETRPEDLMITAVPVIPPKFRPFSAQGNVFIPGDANTLYKELMDMREAFDREATVFGEEGAVESSKGLYAAVKALYGRGEATGEKSRAKGVSGMLTKVLGPGSPKYSFLMRKLLGKTQDNVSRGTIIVNPELGMDEVGIPEDQAWTMYAPHTQRRLVMGGMGAGDALRNVKDRTDAARKAMEREAQDRWVLISRAPVWHKWGILAAKPRFVKGNAIEVNPWWTTGANADFDGDDCINQVLACIPKEAVHAWRMSYPNLNYHEVRFPQGQSIPARVDGRYYLFDLEDFPRGDLTRTVDGANGPIDFHAQALPIEVLAYDELTKALTWAPVSHWSRHYGRIIEIVDFTNDYQLVSDDDPRAVYGTAAGELAMRRFTPDEALRMKALVPRATRLPKFETTVERLAVTNTTDNVRAHRMKVELELTADLGWFIGAMCGDGWIIKDHGTLPGVAMADNDGYNIAKVRAVLPGLFEHPYDAHAHAVPMVRAEAGRLGDTVSYRFTGANLAAFIQPLIGGGRDEHTAGSGNKHLPVFYLGAPEEFRSGLMAGLMDTDGSISVSNGKAKPQLMSSLGSCSIRMAQEVKLLAASLGIRSRITPSSTPLGKAFWQVTFNAEDVQRWGGRHMAHQGKLAKLRSIPQIEAAGGSRNDLVPVPEDLARAMSKLVGSPKITPKIRAAGGEVLAEKKATSACYMGLLQAATPTHTKYGMLSRYAALRVLERLGESVVRELPQGAEWLAVVRSEGVAWERVTGVQKTGVREDGYDLTVPGYDTFMAADGLVLSNTVTLHTPASQAAMKEAREKLRLSASVFKARNPDEVMGAPKQEHILGLYASQVRKPTKVHKFPNRDMALAAVRRGDIPLEDEVDFGDEPAGQQASPRLSV